MAKQNKNRELETPAALSSEEAGALMTEARKSANGFKGKNRTSAVISPEGVRLGTKLKVSVRRHDFTNPSIISEREVDRLIRLHQEMISALEAEASLFLRSEVAMKFSEMKIVDFRMVLRDLEDPTHLALFRADPLPGIGFLEISPRLALSAVNQVMGGEGQVPKAARHLTKIETDLIEEFVVLLLQAWLNQWQYETALVPSVVEHEVSPSNIQICESNTPMMRYVLDVKLRACEGRIQVVVPIFMVESMIRSLQGQSLKKVESTAKIRRPSWQQGYSDVPVPADVKVNVCSMKVGEFTRLKIGDVIPLQKDCMDNAILRLAGKAFFAGQYGVDGEKMALCIQSKIQS